MIKIGRFFEEHVEKIILVVVGLVCLLLLITRVIFSPNVVPCGKEKLSPGAIDDHIYKEANDLRRKLGEAPDELQPYETRIGEFLALHQSSISDVDIDLWLPRPYNIATETAIRGKYRLPRSIGEVNDVAVEHIRAVAYVPTEVVTAQNPYDKSGNEPNDIDLVTVEGKYDVAQLCEMLEEIFVDDVEEQYADPCLAKPVFAAVQLQRQELSANGVWSDWQIVPRTRIDQHRKLFEIVEDIKDLPPGGLKVQMLQFDDKYMQIDLLQPQAYQFASAKEEWYPPLLHRKFLDFQRKEAQEERRQAQEEERQEREKEMEEKRSRRSETRLGGAGGRGAGGGILNPLGGNEGSYGGRNTRNRSDRSRDRGRQGSSRTAGGGLYSEGDSTGRRRSRRTTTTTDSMNLYDEGMMGRPGESGRARNRQLILDVYDEYDKLLLTRATDFKKMREPLVFWGHDDTVEPKKAYRYRIRLGVFNPVAGTNQLSEQEKSRNNEVVLWSDFSDTTEAVEIPGRLYFFAKSIREAGKTITVQVSKLTLGHWYSHDFAVRHGEVIGDVIEPEPEKTERSRTGRLTSFVSPQDKAAVPEMIDYSTGAVLVDALPVNDWTGDRALRTRRYYDMLYSFDGLTIEHMPVNSTYWTVDLKTMFSHIENLQEEKQEPFKAFGTAGRRRGPRGGYEYEGIEDYGAMYEDMMNEDMGGRGRR
jgi:hypothetical protein